MHNLAPVIGVDIDGTLGDYHTHFKWFLNAIYFPGNTLRLDWNRSSEFSEALGMRKEQYRAAKLAYRLGGLKRCLPLFDNDYKKDGPRAVMSEIQFIRSMGIQVWITTQRPWAAMTSVDDDTKFWLNQYVGEVDGLIFAEDKYQALIDNVGQKRIVGVIDDLPDCLERAHELGLEYAIRRGDHNQWWLNEQVHKANMGQPYCNPKHFSRIKDLSAVVSNWMENHDG